MTHVCGWHAISVTSKTNLRIQLSPTEPEMKEICKKCKTVLLLYVFLFLFLFLETVIFHKKHIICVNL